MLRGEMAERLKAHAWKACVPKGTVGSNPTLSAIQPAGAETSAPGSLPNGNSYGHSARLRGSVLANPNQRLAGRRRCQAEMAASA